MDNSGSELLKVYTSGMTNNSMIDNQMDSMNSSQALASSFWEMKASNLSDDPFLQSYDHNESWR